MGARRRMGSGIPGYSGPALPRATRSSSRGRAGGSRKVGLSFDWLAEVAGQELLHSGDSGEHKRDSLKQHVQSDSDGAMVVDATPSPEDKFVAKDGQGKQEDVKSDNESGTSFAVDPSVKQKLLNIQCQINQASHEEEMKEKNKAEAAAAVAAATAAANPDGGDAVADKPVTHVSSAHQAKVKDEECSSECIMSEEGDEKQKVNRRPRKRKHPCRASNWGSQTKRSKQPTSAKAASVATSPKPRKSVDGHVKVSVKSFTIPELYVDIPESATVGTLKRAVMDAAMNLLGGGLRVCVLVQGRKVPDEAATLSEMGILHGAKSDLGFMLEPTSIPSSTADKDDPLLVLLHAASEPTPRCPAAFVVDKEWSRPPTECTQQQPDAAATASAPVPNTPPNAAEASQPQWEPAKPLADNDEQTKNESDSTSTLSQATPYKPRVLDAKAIILHPAMGSGAGAENAGQGMALVPMRPKNHQLEIHKRRIRRPFSVGEVESLVRAVEQLGTGRWRDVKLQAFENAKHRTYVDLKDKWKTLVHTAQIAPHQRRGDPVPQELLDRVIAANNYWAAHQAKEQAELEA